MLRRNQLKVSYEQGFTLIEVVITITLIAVVSTAIFTFTNTSLNQYLGLQTNSSALTDLAMQSQRIANVTRGLTDIVSPTSNDLTIYAYFSPNNNYVSLMRYYLGGGGTILYADVTPMTANPPIGTPITASKKTYVITNNYASVTGVNLFNYLDAAGNVLSMPIADQHTIKGIQINLAVPSKSPTVNGTQTMVLNVTLRNRKTNL